MRHGLQLKGITEQRPCPALPSLTPAAQSHGVMRHGRRLGADGRLVGAPTGDALLDASLQLPTDALAVLSAELTFA